MSSATLTTDVLASEAVVYSPREIWRLVEAQHLVSTMKLVENLAEQELLEEMLDEFKPRLEPALREYHYLLQAPFRYALNKPGSRFRSQGESGVFYGSEHVHTAVAEMAFCRLLFFSESPDTPLPLNALDFSAFSVGVSSDQSLDLTVGMMAEKLATWTDPVDYGPCQKIATQARKVGVDLIRFRSVRDPEARCNIALLHWTCFTSTDVAQQQTWKIVLKPDQVVAYSENTRETLSFDRLF